MRKSGCIILCKILASMQLQYFDMVGISTYDNMVPHLQYAYFTMNITTSQQLEQLYYAYLLCIHHVCIPYGQQFCSVCVATRRTYAATNLFKLARLKHGMIARATTQVLDMLRPWNGARASVWIQQLQYAFQQLDLVCIVLLGVGILANADADVIGISSTKCTHYREYADLAGCSSGTASRLQPPTCDHYCKGNTLVRHLKMSDILQSSQFTAQIKPGRRSWQRDIHRDGMKSEIKEIV